MTCRILIVDSDDNSRTILSRRLVRRGFEVFLAADGLKGIAEVENNRPDVILMDLSVVTADCWNTARELKRRPDTKEVPIVAMSVLDLTWDEEAALEAGCDLYLSKPVDMEMLGNVLDQVTQSKCAPQQPH